MLKFIAGKNDAGHGTEGGTLPWASKMLRSGSTVPPLCPPPFLPLPPYQQGCVPCSSRSSNPNQWIHEPAPGFLVLDPHLSWASLKAARLEKALGSVSMFLVAIPLQPGRFPSVQDVCVYLSLADCCWDPERAPLRFTAENHLGLLSPLLSPVPVQPVAAPSSTIRCGPQCPALLVLPSLRPARTTSAQISSFGKPSTAKPSRHQHLNGRLSDPLGPPSGTDHFLATRASSAFVTFSGCAPAALKCSGSFQTPPAPLRATRVQGCSGFPVQSGRALRVKGPGPQSTELWTFFHHLQKVLSLRRNSTYRSSEQAYFSTTQPENAGAVRGAFGSCSTPPTPPSPHPLPIRLSLFPGCSGRRTPCPACAPHTPHPLDQPQPWRLVTPLPPAWPGNWVGVGVGVGGVGRWALPITAHLTCSTFSIQPSPGVCRTGARVNGPGRNGGVPARGAQGVGGVTARVGLGVCARGWGLGCQHVGAGEVHGGGAGRCESVGGGVRGGAPWM